jgi:hypothetical protein
MVELLAKSVPSPVITADDPSLELSARSVPEEPIKPQKI